MMDFKTPNTVELENKLRDEVRSTDWTLQLNQTQLKDFYKEHVAKEAKEFL